MPLNAEGEEEAKALAEVCRDLPLTKVYSSPLIRASDSTKAVVELHPHLKVELVPALTNQYCGSRQGTAYSPDFDWTAPPPPDVESCDDAHLPPIDETPVKTVQGHDAYHHSDDQVVLALTHLRIIKAIRSLLTRNDLSTTAVAAELALGVDDSASPANAKLELIRFWRDPGGPGRQGCVRARLEGLGSG